MSKHSVRVRTGVVLQWEGNGIATAVPMMVPLDAKRGKGAYLAQEDTGCCYQGGVDQIIGREAVLICCQRSSAGVQLCEGRVLVQRLVAIVLRHSPGKAIRESDQQRSSERICGVPT